MHCCRLPYLLSVLFATNPYAQTPPMPDDFVDMMQLSDELDVQMRYFTQNNFIGQQVEGYQANKCFLQKKAAQALVKVAEQATQAGYKLRVYDCYRPQRAVNHFMRWAADLSDTLTKAEYYPELEKQQLINQYIAENSGHSRGSTLDLTLLQQHDQGHWQELDMGSPYDFFGSISNVGSPLINAIQQHNRQLLLDLMQQQNFIVYDMEWWHFTHQPPVYTDTYFDFVIK